MDDYLKIEVIDGRLSVTALKELSTQDFAPVAKTNEDGCVLSFIEMLSDETPWTFIEGEMSHTASLKIAFCYAPQLLAKINELKNTGWKADQLTLVYLMDLFKVYELVLDKPIKGKRTEQVKSKALEELKMEAKDKEKELYEKALKSFNKAIAMLAEM
jgi:hypothetical protein